jgi:hypothetical protein
MRISFLLASLLCGLASLCLASDQPRKVSPSRFDSVSGIVHPDDLGQALADRAVRERLRRDLAEDGDVTCYTVQSYLVKRQSRDPDAVEAVGYSTCQRASKYGVKRAGETDKAASR